MVPPEMVIIPPSNGSTSGVIALMKPRGCGTANKPTHVNLESTSQACCLCVRTCVSVDGAHARLCDSQTFVAAAHRDRAVIVRDLRAPPLTIQRQSELGCAETNKQTNIWNSSAYLVGDGTRWGKLAHFTPRVSSRSIAHMHLHGHTLNILYGARGRNRRRGEGRLRDTSDK